MYDIASNFGPPFAERKFRCQLGRRNMRCQRIRRRASSPRDSSHSRSRNARDTSTRARRTLPCVVALAERESPPHARSRLGRNRESGHHGQLDRSRAGRALFLPFTKRSRVPNRDGRGDFFFRRAPICRCRDMRDAGKRKFAGETKTSVDRRSQNRA